MSHLPNRGNPLCTRVVLEALGQKINAREALRKCGLFEPGANEIEPETEAMIENRISSDDYHFRVAPDFDSTLRVIQ